MMTQLRPYEYRARLMERSNGRHPVYDGDTIWLTVDLGFGITFDLGDCRLYGIDTPELRGDEIEEGKRVRDFVRALFDQPGNQTFLVRTHKQDEKGKWGRYLATVEFYDGTILNDLLLRTGMAQPYTGS